MLWKKKLILYLVIHSNINNLNRNTKRLILKSFISSLLFPCFMSLLFITGNEHKFREVASIIPFVKQLNLDLPEIQSTDAKEIITAKLFEAKNQLKDTSFRNNAFIVEDTSLYLDALHGHPGPLIKWYLQPIDTYSPLGIGGLYELAKLKGNYGAYAKTCIGYYDGTNQPKFFEGLVGGLIVVPRGSTTFGWNPIFQPLGSNKTFGEMTLSEKNKYSMRKLASSNLLNYLKTM